MSDIWVCPHCGYENEDTERIAMKETCRRCKEERTTPDELNEYIRLRLEQLQSDKEDICNKIDDYNAEIEKKGSGDRRFKI